jgi:hypothetical protein
LSQMHLPTQSYDHGIANFKVKVLSMFPQRED